ncbi:MAG: hypothetical protein CVU06_06095 [Bacteroidetes bacterium HGW-Bacteroidetes-22]|nr:MAG: hypothetical protein CVU06_06095 [Bacteroidetes bacterium HGW-Bacteroidetes-22]
MIPIKRFPVVCPACGSDLHVKSLACDHCQTAIEGRFDIPVLCRLEVDDQQFLVSYIKNNGSLKEMARIMNLSYPSVRNRLDDIIARILKLESSTNHES